MHKCLALAAVGVFTAAFAVVSAGPVAAQTEPTRVLIPICDFLGGEETVPAGPVVADFGGWAVGPRGALVHWLKSQETTIAVTDAAGATTVIDATDLWGSPDSFEKHIWGSNFAELDLGVLDPGDSVLVEWSFSWTKPTLENFYDGNGPVLTKGNEVTATCLITAE